MRLDISPIYNPTLDILDRLLPLSHYDYINCPDCVQKFIIRSN